LRREGILPSHSPRLRERGAPRTQPVLVATKMHSLHAWHAIVRRNTCIQAYLRILAVGFVLQDSEETGTVPRVICGGLYPFPARRVRSAKTQCCLFVSSSHCSHIPSGDHPRPRTSAALCSGPARTPTATRPRGSRRTPRAGPHAHPSGSVMYGPIIAPEHGDTNKNRTLTPESSYLLFWHQVPVV